METENHNSKNKMTRFVLTLPDVIPWHVDTDGVCP
jgi:hypothetical protein